MKKNNKKTNTKKRTKKTQTKKLNIKKLKAHDIEPKKPNNEYMNNEKIISGVSQGISDLTGIPTNIVRIMFLISFICIIGIPIYLIIALIIKND